jgi:predicted dehydrogenase
MTERERLGFGLVGCGRIAQRYGAILRDGRVEGGRLVAACDVKADRAEAFAGRWSVPTFPDADRMLAAHGSEIDVLCILTESGLHARHTIDLAAHGKHLVVEKPMALTLDDADEMIRVCDEAGVKLFVVKQNRLNRAIQRTREALEAGRFGRLTLGTVRVRWCRTQEYYDQDAWRGTWALDGGVLANQASHHVDLLEWMMGPPESVFAMTHTALARIETEDTACAVLRFRHGALGIIEATTAARPTDLEGSLSLLGSHGTVEVGGFAVNEIKTWRFADALPGDEAAMREGREAPPNVYGFGHEAYLAHVVRAVRDGTPSLVDGLEGRKSLELIAALYESAATGREVRLRFRPHAARLGEKR